MPTDKTKKVIRGKGGAAGGNKRAQSGGAYIPSQVVTVQKKKTPKLKPMDIRSGGVVKRATPNKLARSRKK